MSAMPDFYQGKTVLLTGHTGFKGSWMAHWLKLMGARVVGLALPPEPGQPSLYEEGRIAEGMVSVLGDVRDGALVQQLLQEHQPEIVFHLAAQPLVRRSYREPVDTFATNVMGTVHLLEAVRHTPSVRAVVIVTTDKCYENKEWLWGYRETDPLGGHDPYSSSKACAELVTSAYRSSFFHRSDSAAIATARAGNVIGGGDWAEDRLIPDMVRSLSNERPVIIRNPRATRPWQHVLEPLAGYLMLGERLYTEGHRWAEAWNFGPHRESGIPVSDLAERVLRLWGTGEILVQQDPHAVHEAHALHLDASKAQLVMGWRPILSLDETLSLTIDWYRQYASGSTAPPDLLTTQTEAYMARL